ncbi:MAG: UBP-type zinc finger domain-containing protein [Rudanella sp.]|nr:UBP-type zinc finger domain-containing protein [Rudanella sp.]
MKTGDSWVHLRTCQACGTTLCCDSSSNQHATKHLQESGHIVVASAKPGECWLWCYVDEQITRYWMTPHQNPTIPFAKRSEIPRTILTVWNRC